ncbi:MAG: hypothetical protein ACI4HO_08680 [Ruminococcus sp.]
MSVIKSKRSTSRLEFLATARELELYTIRTCASALPKRYTFYIGQEMSALSVQIYIAVKRANRYNLNVPEEAKKRRELFLKAASLTGALAAQIELVNELNIGLKMSRLEEWARLADRESYLISAVMKSDNQRTKAK